MMERCLITAMVIVVTIILAPLNAAAASIGVRFGQHADYGRMVIEHPHADTAGMIQSGTMLEFDFDRPVDLDIADMPKDLSAWVDEIERINDRLWRITLKPGVKANLKRWQSGMVVVDFTNAEKARKPKLQLRVGKHSAFARLVIEAAVPFEFSDRATDNKIELQMSLTFDAADQQRLKQLSPYVEKAEITGKALKLTLAEGIGILRRKQISDRRYFWDFGAQLAEAGTQSDVHEDTIEIVAGDRGDQEIHEVENKRAEERSPIAHAVEPKRQTADDEISLKESNAAGPLEPDSGMTLSTPHGGLSELPSSFTLRLVADDGEIGPIIRFDTGITRPAAFFVRGRVFWAIFHGRAQLIDPIKDDLNQIISSDVSNIRQVPHDDATILRFELRQRSKLSVSLNNGLWEVAFGQSSPLSTERIVDRGDLGLSVRHVDVRIEVNDPVIGDLLGVGLSSVDDDGSVRRRYVDVEFLESLQGIVWRPLGQQLNVSAERNMLKFSSTLRQQPQTKDEDKSPSGDVPHSTIFNMPSSDDQVLENPTDRQNREDHEKANGKQNSRTQTEAGYKQNSAAVSYSDTLHPPSTDYGDAPHGSKGHDQQMPHSISANARIAQIQTHHDGLQHSQANTTSSRQHDPDDSAPVAPDHELGADIANSPQDRTALQAPQPNTNATNDATLGMAFGFIDWKKRYPAHRRIPALSIAETELEALDTARHLIALAFGAEALATLDSFDAAAPELSNQQSYQNVEQSLRVAANYLMGRLDRAQELLDGLEIEPNDEFRLWQTALDTAHRRWRLDRETALAIADTLRAYPEKLRPLLGLPAARNSLESGFADPAYVILDELRRKPLKPDIKLDLDLLWALVLERDGAIDRAVGTVDSVIEQASTIDKVAQARFHKTMMQHRGELIDASTAIKELTEQRLFWRGHADEPIMLESLAGLLVEDGELLDGLELYEDAIRHDQIGNHAQSIVEKINKLVATSLTEKQFDGHSLLGLILFNRYGHVVTDDKVRQQIAENLASELAEDGFPDVAASILDEQRGFVLGGGRAETRLAVAERQLKAGNAEAVFATLPYEDSAIPVEARARLALKETEIARSLLDGRADIDSTISVIESLWIDQNLHELARHATSLAQRNDLAAANPKELEHAILRIASAQLSLGRFADLRSLLKAIDDNEAVKLAPEWNTVLYDKLDMPGDIESMVAEISELIPSVRSSIVSLTSIAN